MGGVFGFRPFVHQMLRDRSRTLFESLPLTCPNCGADMRLIAFITEAAPVERILTHIGEPPRPPLITPARPCAALSCSAWVPARTILVRSFAASAQLTHPPGTMLPRRCRTGISSNSPSRTSKSISALPGSRNRQCLGAGAQPPLCSNRPLPPAVALRPSAEPPICPTISPLSTRTVP